METLLSTKTNKSKTIEVKFSNMSFIVEATSHYVSLAKNKGWTKTKFTAKIKETGEGIGVIGSKTIIKNQMHLINSRPDLFLK